MIAGYNAAEPTALRFLMRVIAARITLRGFIVLRLSSRATANSTERWARG